MSRVKVTIVTLFAVVAMSAVAAGSASANWFVNGTQLGSGTAVGLATTAHVDADTVLFVPALKLEVKCSSELLRGESAEIIGTNSGKAKSLKFESCNTIAPATGCALAETNQAIGTLGISATLTKGSGEADRALFSPQTKSTFAEIAFNAENECAFTSKTAVKGFVTVGAPTGQLELTGQAIEGLGSVENNSLEIGSGNKAFLVGGKALLQTTNGSKWSFH